LRLLADPFFNFFFFPFPFLLVFAIPLWQGLEERGQGLLDFLGQVVQGPRLSLGSCLRGHLL